MRIQLKIKQTRFKSLERIFWYPILILYVLQKNKNLFREGRLGIWQLCLDELLSIEKLCIILLIHKTQTESYHQRLKSTSQSSKPIVNAPNIWIFVDFLLCFICFRWLWLIQHTVTSIGTRLIWHISLLISPNYHHLLSLLSASKI